MTNAQNTTEDTAKRAAASAWASMGSARVADRIEATPCHSDGTLIGYHVVGYEDGVPAFVANAVLDEGRCITIDDYDEAAQTLFYVDYRNGNCSMIDAADEATARVHAQEFANSFHTRVRLVRPATAEDRQGFSGAIYRVDR